MMSFGMVPPVQAAASSVPAVAAQQASRQASGPVTERALKS